MLAWLRVTVNEDKTRIVPASAGFDFLGVHFPQAANATRPAVCYCWPSRRSMERIRDNVRTLIGRIRVSRGGLPAGRTLVRYVRYPFRGAHPERRDPG